ISTFARPARREELGTLIQFVMDGCATHGLDAQTLSDLRLAVEEACTNLIEHAYPADAPGPIELTVSADDDRVVVEIRDQAPPFDPAGLSPPDLGADWQDRPVGGLGWHLIRSVMDEVRYVSDAAGNRLTLVKRRPPSRA
ncbi:MAG: ATP-binding protein, partial [Burkholderiales bacterium]